MLEDETRDGHHSKESWMLIGYDDLSACVTLIIENLDSLARAILPFEYS